MCCISIPYTCACIYMHTIYFPREVFPEKGALSRPALDCPEIAKMVYEARTLLQMILSSHGPPQRPADQQHLLSAVISSCCLAFRECFHVFYPSVPLKWLALCQQLQYLDPVSGPWCFLRAYLKVKTLISRVI